MCIYIYGSLMCYELKLTSLGKVQSWWFGPTRGTLTSFKLGFCWLIAGFRWKFKAIKVEEKKAGNPATCGLGTNKSSRWNYVCTPKLTLQPNKNNTNNNSPVRLHDAWTVKDAQILVFLTNQGVQLAKKKKLPLRKDSCHLRWKVK